MAFDFPNSPTPGTVYIPSGGPTYVWDGTVWTISDTAPSLVTAHDGNILVNPRFQIAQETPQGTTFTASNQYVNDQWMGLLVVNAGNPSYASVVLSTDDWTIPEEAPLYVARLTHGGTPTPAPAANNNYRLQQPVERTRTRPLAWFQPSQANRKPAVLRFAAKLVNMLAATTFSVSIRDETSTVSWLGEFTVPQADNGKWKQYTAVIPAPPGGTWGGVDTDPGMHFAFTLMSGTTYKAPAAGWNAGNFLCGPNQSNLIGAAGANTMDIANVGLYVDPDGTGIAPPFQAGSTASDLAECQRYYYKNAAGAAAAYICQGYASGAGGAAYGSWPHPVQMRVAPTMVFINTATSNVSGGAMPIGNVDQWSFRTSISASAAGTLYCVFGPVANARM